jgi:sodium/potassium-transporting ATPase subunit alpha
MKFKLSNLKIPKPKIFSRNKYNDNKPSTDDLDSDLTYHKMSLTELAGALETSVKDGLDQSKASQLLSKNGRNVIEQKGKNPVFKFIGYFFTGFCTLIWVAAIICILAYKPIGEIGGETPDPINLALGILLIIVIFLQAGFSAFQDWSSGKVMKSIKNLLPSSATVIRNGVEHKIQTEEIVVGDLLILSYGNKVAADLRIVESRDLKFDKSLLTGESEAIEGTIECTDERYVESKNIGFMTTLVTNGNGKGIVVATGKNTMIGQISSLTTGAKKQRTSLQKELNRFVFIIGSAAILMAIIVILVWSLWLRTSYPNYISFPSFLVNTISVMIAFIPEG